MTEEIEEGKFLSAFTIHGGSTFICDILALSCADVFSLSLFLFFSVWCLDVQEGWRFRPPPRGVTSSEEYTLCKR